MRFSGIRRGNWPARGFSRRLLVDLATPIKELEAHGAFIRVLSREVPRDGVCIDGRFVYAMKHNPLKAAPTKTEAYTDDQRWRDALLGVEVFQESSGGGGFFANSTIKSLIVLLSSIAYRKWNFRVMGVLGAFLQSNPLDRDISAAPTICGGIPDGKMATVETLYRLSTACKE